MPARARTSIDALLAARERLREAIAPLRAYVEHRDFVEDGYAGSTRLWRDAVPALTAYLAAAAEARAAVIPPARAIIREVQATHERAAGRDATWWRIEIGLAQRDLAAIAVTLLAPRGDQRADLSDPSALAAALAPAHDVLEPLIASAPLEIRREVRDSASQRDRILDNDPTNTLADLIHLDDDLLAATTAEGEPLLVEAYR